MRGWKDNLVKAGTDGMRRNAGRIAVFLCAALALIGASFVTSTRSAQVLVLVGLTLLLVLGMSWAQARLRLMVVRPPPVLRAYLETDATPAVFLDRDFEPIWANSAATTLFPPLFSRGISASLSDLGVDGAATMRRLRRAALSSNPAHEVLVGRHGHFRLILWSNGSKPTLLRLEPLSRQNLGDPGETPIPQLTISKSGTVIAMNEALRRLTGQRAKHVDQVFQIAPLPGDARAELKTLGGRTPVLVHQTPLSGGRRDLALIAVEGGPEPCRDTGLEALPVAVLRLARDGRILASNGAARALLSLRQPVGTVNLTELLTGPGRDFGDWLEEAFQAHQQLQPETLRLRDTTTERFLQVTLSRTDGADGAGLTAVLHDATAFKTLEAQFVQSQKMQAIGQLAGGVAHDFNNLLTAISGHCDLLLLRHAPGDAEYGDLIQINQNANRAAALVGQLLAFSRKQTLNPEALDIRDTLSDLTHLLNRLVGEKIRLNLINAQEKAYLRADKRQLEQVLMNLVVNARDAMPEGGEIVIETRVQHLETPVARGRVVMPVGDYVCVCISDQGIGIPQDQIEKIFEPFFTTKRPGEGTGLGLSTAYGIVKQSGGFIFASSLPGKGTEFELFFPAHHPDSTPVPVPLPFSEAPEAVWGQGVVLLVEDEAPVRAFAARALRLAGYTVLEAENGESALEMLENPALSVDLFLSDVIMPGLDGPTWVRKALSDRAGTPVVFMSGYAEDALSGRDDEVPQAAFLQKPFSLKDLTLLANRQIAGSAARSDDQGPQAEAACF